MGPEPRRNVVAAGNGRAAIAAQFFEAVRPVLAEVSGKAPGAILQVNDLNLDLGLDSLKRLELAMLIDEALGVAIDDATIGEVGTVADLCRLLSVEAIPPAAPDFRRWARGGIACTVRGAVQRAVLFPLLNRWCPVTPRGLQNLEEFEGPLLFIANHNSHLDTPALLAALPPRFERRLVVAAAADYFYSNAVLGSAASLALNTFPFVRSGSLRPSFEYCGEAVDAGWSLLVYPEGTRSTSGDLGPFKSGIGLLAKELEVPVAPVWIAGTHRLLPKGRTRPERGPITICFGPVITVDARVPAEEIAGQLRDAVARLKPQDPVAEEESDGLAG